MVLPKGNPFNWYMGICGGMHEKCDSNESWHEAVVLQSGPECPPFRTILSLKSNRWSLML